MAREVTQMAVGARILENRAKDVARVHIVGVPTMTSIPSGAARVFITAMFCGWQFSSTKNAVAFDLATRCAMVIASAQAVASSSSEALEISSPVRSDTMVWKFKSASRRPCEISG